MPPAFRERQGPGSFRGTPFIVLSSELSGGRRTVRHEYPLRDVPFVEDLGRQGRRIKVTAFVCGSDYITKRDALLKSLEEPGPGPLELPYHGSRHVALVGHAVVETHDEGGKATFSLEFEETVEKAANPNAVPAAQPRVAASADSGLLANKRALPRRFTTVLPNTSTGTALPGLGRVKPMPSWSLASASNFLKDASSAMRRVLAPVVATHQQLASLKRQTDSLISDATSLVREPVLLATRFTSLLSSIASMPATPVLGVSALLKALTFMSSTPRPVATSATRLREQQNFDAVNTFVRTGLLIQAARLAAVAASPSAAAAHVVHATSGAVDATQVAGTTDGTSAAVLAGQPARLPDGTLNGGYETYDEAIIIRDQVVQAIDAAIGVDVEPSVVVVGAAEPISILAPGQHVVDDELYVALVQIRSDLVAAVPGERSRLPRLVSYTLVVSEPSIVLTYRLYGDLARLDDVIDRNRIAHPGFVRGGRALQVLSNA
jgi:prophage DNA circulation protein